MKMLMVICNRDKTKKVIKQLNDNDIKYHTSFYGKGTANTKMLAYFGLVDTLKEIVVSFISNEKEVEIMEIFRNSPEFLSRGGAVALTVPLDFVSKSTLDYIGL